MGTAEAYRRSSRKAAGEVVFQVLAYVTGIQVPLDDGRKFGIDFGREVLQGDRNESSWMEVELS